MKTSCVDPETPSKNLQGLYIQFSDKDAEFSNVDDVQCEGYRTFKNSFDLVLVSSQLL